jgi:beta-mannosidase
MITGSYSPDEPDLLLSDNFFDIDAGTKEVSILRGNPKTLLVRSVFDIR